jgi:hypothetical protein
VLLDLRSGRYLALNAVGGAVLEGVRRGLALEDISAGVAARCEAPLERVAPDSQRFLAELVSAGLVESGVNTVVPTDESAPAGDPFPAVPPARVWMVPAYVVLVAVDAALRLFGFGRLHRWLHRLPPAGPAPDPGRARRLAQAVDRAAAFYPKRAWCLERSLVTWLLMRARRWPARLVLGAKRLPFGAHAWVEMDGEVVNDDPRVCRGYRVLERCG